jgi:predicted nucleotide-binding protein
LFGSHESRRGLAVITTFEVVDVIVPSDRMVAYFLYYLARYALTFCAPHMSNHDDTRACIFDRKILKTEIVHSMRSRAFCDPCRQSLITGEGSLNARQFSTIERILALAGRIIRDGTEKSGKPRVFVGSSTAGLAIANQLQELLGDQLSVVIWNQGTVFSLGDSTREALENAVLEYSAGIFVFTADDLRVKSSGQTDAVARDNVIFELGLFIGKLGRKRALVVLPGDESITLPSDLHGITTATFDYHERNLAAALGPAANKIRRALSELQGLQHPH